MDDFVSNTGSEYVESDESHNVEWSCTIPQDKNFPTVITKFPGSMFKPIRPVPLTASPSPSPSPAQFF